jgi:hypothetical protein
MRPELERIEDQLRRAFEGEAWHGPSVLESLEDVTHEEAAARLDAPLVPESPYTAYTQFIGTTQHDLYHAGQIAILKRALRRPTSSDAKG